MKTESKKRETEINKQWRKEEEEEEKCFNLECDLEWVSEGVSDIHMRVRKQPKGSVFCVWFVCLERLWIWCFHNIFSFFLSFILSVLFLSLFSILPGRWFNSECNHHSLPSLPRPPSPPPLDFSLFSLLQFNFQVMKYFVNWTEVNLIIMFSIFYFENSQAEGEERMKDSSNVASQSFWMGKRRIERVN